MVSKIPSAEVLHHHVEELPILESRLHVDDEAVAELIQDALLVNHRGDALLEEHLGL